MGCPCKRLLKKRRSSLGKHCNMGFVPAWDNTYQTACSGRVTKRMFRPIHAISGLYAITPDCADTSDLLRRTRLVLAGGASMLQYRNKTSNKALRVVQAQCLRELTRQFHVPLIINDDVQLAAQVDADGVHLGATDASPDTARTILGRQKIIGVSCYNSSSLARKAVTEGADYLAFGAFFYSMVKPDAVVADVGLLRQMRSEVKVPLVAIGGITAQNGAELIKAGSDALAVISALFDAADIQAAAQDFLNLFIRNSEP
jgi:thiamine-phosphate pyrophosphorylase